MRACSGKRNFATRYRPPLPEPAAPTLRKENAFRAESEICRLPRFSASTSDFLSGPEADEVLSFVGRERSRLDAESFADDMAELPVSVARHLENERAVRPASRETRASA